MEELDIISQVQQYGFPIILALGLGYFIYYVWWFISEHIEPEIEDMHIALIRVIDQTRMLDQDLIRLQQKVDVVLEYRENEKKKSGKTPMKKVLILSCILTLGVNADEIKFGFKNPSFSGVGTGHYLTIENQEFP